MGVGCITDKSSEAHLEDSHVRQLPDTTGDRTVFGGYETAGDVEKTCSGNEVCAAGIQQTLRERRYWELKRRVDGDCDGLLEKVREVQRGLPDQSEVIFEEVLGGARQPGDAEDPVEGDGVEQDQGGLADARGDCVDIALSDESSAVCFDWSGASSRDEAGGDVAALGQGCPERYTVLCPPRSWEGREGEGDPDGQGLLGGLDELPPAVRGSRRRIRFVRVSRLKIGTPAERLLYQVRQKVHLSYDAPNLRAESLAARDADRDHLRAIRALFERHDAPIPRVEPDGHATSLSTLQCVKGLYDDKNTGLKKKEEVTPRTSNNWSEIPTYIIRERRRFSSRYGVGGDNGKGLPDGGRLSHTPLPLSASRRSLSGGSRRDFLSERRESSSDCMNDTSPIVSRGSTPDASDPRRKPLILKEGV